MVAKLIRILCNPLPHKKTIEAEMKLLFDEEEEMSLF